jgi:hypothetical protein
MMNRRHDRWYVVFRRSYTGMIVDRSIECPTRSDAETRAREWNRNNPDSTRNCVCAYAERVRRDNVGFAR